MAGLESSGPQLGRIDPSSLIGRADTEVVSPRATAALADAFRQGFVTVDDIMERVGERAQLKKKADIMQLQEAMSPLAIEARKHGLEAANLEAQLGIDLSPAKREALKAEYGAKTALAQISASGLASPAAELQQAGWLPPIPPKGIDNKWQEETIRRWGVLQEFKRKQQESGMILKAAEKPELIKTQIGETEGIMPTVFHEGKKLSDKEIESAKQFSTQYTHPALWEKAGKPDLFGKPGEVSEPAPKATATKAAATAAEQPQAAVASAPGSTALAPGSSQPIINVNLGGQPVSQLKPNVMVENPPMAPMIEATPETVQPAATPAKANIFPPGFIETGPAKTPPGRAFTEAQQKALIAEARGLVTQPILDNPGFNPGDTAANLRMKAYNSGTLGELVTTLGPSKAKITDAERNYANAQSQWIQGLLRVESGAAISKKEQGWYEKAFFPAIGDPPAIQKQKSDARKAILSSLDSVITGKQSPEEYQAMRDKVGQTVGAAPTTTGAPGVVNSYKTAQEALASGDKQFWLNGKLYQK